MLKITLVVLLMASFFLYGLAVGYYQIFPFDKINKAKYLLSGKEPSEYTVVNEPDYLNKKTFFELKYQNDYDIVFIGDSLTGGSDWYDIFPNYTIANRGVRGDTTEGVLNRIDTIINTKAEKAFIMMGTNDINAHVNVENIIKNYKKILDNLEANNITPIVQSTLLTYGTPQERNKDINELNAELKAICLERDITYVDLNEYLSENGTLSDKFSYDGLHLNGQGYVLWAEAISKYIE